MTEKLLNVFVKSREEETKEKYRTRVGEFAGIVGIVTNVLLSFIKFIIGIISSSVAITGDAINNLADSATSILSVVAFRIASKPADKKHPFGHARIEYIVSMLLSFFLIFVGVELCHNSIDKIFHPVKSNFTAPVIFILALTVLVKVWLGFFWRKISKKIDSNVMSATSADSFSDAFSTFTVLVCALLSTVTDLNLDGYAGVCVSVFLLINALRILNDTKNNILGTQPDLNLLREIRDYAYTCPEIIGIHDMYIHSYGVGKYFATFHAEVDGKKDFFATHDAVDNVEKGIYSKFGILCTIHMDPIITDDENISVLKEQVKNIIFEIDPEMSMHDFRVVPGETHSIFIFDILVPFHCKMKDDEIVNLVDGKVRKMSPTYFTAITIDRGEKI